MQGFDSYSMAPWTLQSALHSNDEKAEFGYSLDRKSFFIQQTTTITKHARPEGQKFSNMVNYLKTSYIDKLSRNHCYQAIYNSLARRVEARHLKEWSSLWFTVSVKISLNCAAEFVSVTSAALPSNENLGFRYWNLMSACFYSAFVAPRKF